MLDLSKPDSNLISLLEIEIGHRIDGDAWVVVPGSPEHFFIADEDNDRIKKHKVSDEVLGRLKDSGRK